MAQIPKISVIFITKRNGWFDILKDDMERQTFKDFEVIVANDSDDWRDMPGWDVFKPRQKKEGDRLNVCKAYNDCLDKAKGELLVFLQDFIWIPSNGLQRFWDSYQLFPNAMITGVGHKAKNGLEGISETDFRVFGDEEYAKVNYSYWESNWASCPRNFMPRYNEDMDKFYGGDNQYVSYKAEQNGHPTIIDRRNVCIGYSQEHCGGRPEDWETWHVNKRERLQKFLNGDIISEIE